MKRWKKWGLSGAVFLIVALVVFDVSFSLWFPSKDMKRWIESLNIPGRLTVETVSLDPLLRLRIEGGKWFPDPNAYVTSVGIPFIQIKPLWPEVFLGKKEVSFILSDGKMQVSGSARSDHEVVHLSFQTERPGRFPFPVRFARGVKLKGMWQLEADLVLDSRKRRGVLSGNGHVRLTDIQIQVPATPIGRVVLSFNKGTFEFSLDNTVLGLNKILFRGKDLILEGEATIWIDPFTNTATAKGTLYMRPGSGLVVSNPRLDRIIRMLPRDARGNKFVF